MGKIFLLFLLSFSAQAFDTTVLLHSSIRSIQNESCYLDWQKALAQENIHIRKVQITSSLDQSALKELYAKTPFQGLYLIGHFILPQIKIHEIDGGFKKPHSILPLMNMREDFPEYGLTSQEKDYYYSVTNWVGLINLGPRAPVSDYCQYFKRNVLYRTSPQEPVKVAGFIGAQWRDERGSEVGLLINQLQSYGFLSASTLTYSRLNTLIQEASLHKYQYVMIAEHSSAKGHFPEWEDDILIKDLKSYAPKIEFINLFSCSANEPLPLQNNLAQTYLGLSETLGVVTSSVPGGMRYMQFFHEYLKEGMSFGEALSTYLINNLTHFEFDSSLGYSFETYQKNNLAWEAGINFLGDPSLKLYQ